MPLLVPDRLPAQVQLRKEDIFVMGKSRADKQDIRPVRLAILNLMPNKEETEIQILRALSNTPIQIDIDLIRTHSYRSKNTAEEHLSLFYKDFAEIRTEKYDGLIITGAPVEHMEFEDVHYWEELSEIFEFARTNVYSTMFICWAAQAALYYYYGIKKHPADQKIFGVYEYDIAHRTPLTKGLDDSFYSPQSRHTYNRAEDVRNCADLLLLAAREDTGVGLCASLDNRFIFVAGHNEYDKDSLHKEYLRDLAKNLPIRPPINYYKDNDPNREIIMRWRSHGSLLFSNWVNFCVYQETPFDIEEIQTKKVVKFGGSSLSDSKQYLKVRDIVSSDPSRNLVVVSAPGKRFKGDIKVTDLLIGYFECDDLNKKDNILHIIRARFHKIVSDLALDQSLLERIDETMEEIAASTHFDFVLSRGEYLSGILMAHYLGFQFLDPKNIIFFQKDGTIDKEKTYHCIRSAISDGDRLVIPGFYGTGADGRIKTFARGGSDITGSLVAGALGASVYENWTDVDGLMDKDPRKHEDAALIESLSYDEFLKLSEQSDQVYHIDAIAPVMEDDVVLNIRNTNSPSVKGTFIKR